MRRKLSMTNKVRRVLRLAVSMPLVVLLLTGCLEQLLSPHSSGGALNNFFIHLYAGELNDARAYFAPGLVEVTPELDGQIKEAAERLRRYEIEVKVPITEVEKLREELGNGERRQYLPGRLRLRPPDGQSTPPETPTPEEGWQEANILSARMVERGPGWRILDFRIECCGVGE
jgi:hypothetical protein